LTTRLLDFAPTAWQAYQGLRAGEIGRSLKRALEQLADDPELVRADRHTQRYPLVERQLRHAGEVWGVLVRVPGGARWLVLWREIATVIEIGYIGLVPDGSIVQAE
jgi:hypothetical protein